MGSPGSGKTTIGNALGPALQMSVIDIDNDFLEKYWQMPVADKVQYVLYKSGQRALVTSQWTS